MGAPWTKGPWDLAIGGLTLLCGERGSESGPYTPFHAGTATISVSGDAAGTPSGFRSIVSVGYTDRAGDRGIADARLMAAAPDLAEALEPFASLYADHMADLPDEDRVLYIGDGIRLGDLRRARAALSKAKGEGT